MNDLSKLAIDAHGGLKRWNQVSATIEAGGVLWELKEQGGFVQPTRLA
jgi:hypothetical protein